MASKALIQLDFFLFMMSVLLLRYEGLEPVYGFFDVLSSTRVDIIKLYSEKICNMRAL